MQTEQSVQTSIIKYCEKLGWQAFKVDWSKPGMPDLVILTPYETFFCEVKRKGGRLSEVQEWRIEQLRGLNKKVIVAHSLEEFKDAIESNQ